MNWNSVRSFLLVTLGLVALALSHHKGSVKTPQVFPASPSLRCQEVLKIALWGMSKHGGSAVRTLEDTRTIEKALEIFAEKIDPYKILFTASEIEDFKAGGKKEWQSLVKHQSCGYFTAWIESSYPLASHRLAQTVKELSFSDTTPAKPSKKLPVFLKPKTWTRNETELRKRVREMGAEILKTSPEKVLEAYRGNLSLLVASSFEENILPEVPIASVLLAKSVLGTFDPYTTYLSTSEFEDFYSDLSGGTSGIGIRVRKVPLGLLVEEVVQDSVASLSGKIKKNDVIVRVDGTGTKALSIAEVKKLLKGPEDTAIQLEIKRDGSEDENIELTRKHFDFEDAKITSKTIEGGEGNSVGVISIPGFYGSVGFGPDGSSANSSAEDLRKSLEALIIDPRKPEAIVLDLRGNPGGFLEEAVTMASFFVGSQPVVGVIEKNNTRVLREEFQEPLYQGKLVVLVDTGTASAAEVLAGALGDLQRAILVGSQRTYGKGTVQKLFSLDEELLEIGLTQKKGNGVLKLTTSVFYSPLGHSPANGGVKTDVTLPESVMASKEDYGTAPVMDVGEEKPFLDDAALLELQLKQEMHKGLIQTLKDLSASRLTGTHSGTSEDRALLEASSIAADLAKKKNPAL